MKKIVLVVLAIIALAVPAMATEPAEKIDKQPCSMEAMKDAPRVTIDCKIQSIVKRPAWQKIITLGLLTSDVTLAENYTRTFPGGLDSIRCLQKRNPDLALLFGSAVKIFRPDVISHLELCTAENQESVSLYFTDNTMHIFSGEDNEEDPKP